MNTKTNGRIIRNMVAGVALAISLAIVPAQADAKTQVGAKNAERLVSLGTAIRMQMEISQQQILAEQRYQLKHMPLLLDNPAVKVGPLKVIETAGAEQKQERPMDAAATIGVTNTASLAEDILAKALRAPGLMGLSRYIALPALELALESAK